LRPNLSEKMREISVAGFAHVGDAVFELMVRTWLCAKGPSTSKLLHNKTIEFVSAKAQFVASDKILSMLTDDELAIFKRGRNSHVAVPKSATHEEYHAATGVEALFGYLYLSEQTQRLNELFEIIIT